MLTDKVPLWSWRPSIRLWCNPLPCYKFRPLEKLDVPMTFTVILLNLQHSFKKLECSHHGGVSLFLFSYSLFISIGPKDTYSLALAGEHFGTVPIILPSFRKDFETVKIARIFSQYFLQLFEGRTNLEWGFGEQFQGGTRVFFSFFSPSFNLCRAFIASRLIRRHLWSKCFCWIQSQAQQFT